MVDEDELNDLKARNENNYEAIHKNSWPSLSTGDHRGLIIETEFAAEQEKTKKKPREKRLDWHNIKHREKYMEIVEREFNNDRRIEDKLKTMGPFNDRGETETKLDEIIEEMNNKLLACELKTVDEVLEKRTKWEKRKEWYTPALARLTARRKLLRYLQEANGENHRLEMNMIRNQFRKIKKEELKNWPTKKEKYSTINTIRIG